MQKVQPVPQVACFPVWDDVSVSCWVTLGRWRSDSELGVLGQHGLCPACPSVPVSDFPPMTLVPRRGPPGPQGSTAHVPCPPALSAQMLEAELHPCTVHLILSQQVVSTEATPTG